MIRYYAPDTRAILCDDSVVLALGMEAAQRDRALDRGPNRSADDSALGHFIVVDLPPQAFDAVVGR